jgi:hypothetical protein
VGQTGGMKSLLAIVALLLVSACGTGSDGDSDPGGSTDDGPALAVKRLVTALEAGSCDDVVDVVVTPASVDCEVVGSLEGSFADQGVDLDEVTYETGEVTDGSATVTIGWGGDAAEDPDETWDVERVDGEWKVLFDSVE